MKISKSFNYTDTIDVIMSSCYALQLEDQEYPEMHVIEVEPDMMVDVCEDHGFGYTIITPNDIVIPPTTKNDFI